VCLRITSYFVVTEWRLRQASEKHPRWLRICLELLLLKIGDVSCRATEKLLASKSADAAESAPNFWQFFILMDDYFGVILSPGNGSLRKIL
jgi:hypothetical protein